MDGEPQEEGFEYVVFAFLLGLAISNTTSIPDWLKEAGRTEFYIKTGLVMLGAGILFADLMQAGLLGIAQALLVVTAVWFACFWLARRLRVDDEYATMLASAVSICGVSAAIAASRVWCPEASKADTPPRRRPGLSSSSPKATHGSTTPCRCSAAASFRGSRKN